MPLRIDDQPVRWGWTPQLIHVTAPRDEIHVLTDDDTSVIDIATAADGSGAVRRVIDTPPHLRSSVAAVATSTGIAVAYQSDVRELRVATWDGAAWRHEVAATARNGISGLTVAFGDHGLELAYLDGRALQLTRKVGGAWTSRLLVDDDWSTSARSITIDTAARAVYFASGQRAFRVDHAGAEPVVAQIPSPEPDASIVAFGIVDGRRLDVAGRQEFGDYRTFVYDGSTMIATRRPGGEVVRAFRVPHHGDVLLYSLETLVRRASGSWRPVVGTPPAYDLVAQPGPGDTLFGLAGTLLFPTTAVTPAADAAGDGVDRDCDGSDD